MKTWIKVARFQLADQTSFTALPWGVLAINLVIWYVIAALIVRKTMDLAIPLCAQHRFRYQHLRLAAILMMIGGGIIVIISFFVPADYLAYAIFTFMGLLLVALVTWLAAGVFLRPKFIDASLGVFGGPGEQFLAHQYFLRRMG